MRSLNLIIACVTLISLFAWGCGADEPVSTSPTTNVTDTHESGSPDEHDHSSHTSDAVADTA